MVGPSERFQRPQKRRLPPTAPQKKGDQTAAAEEDGDPGGGRDGREGRGCSGHALSSPKCGCGEGFLWEQELQDWVACLQMSESGATTMYTVAWLGNFLSISVVTVKISFFEKDLV